MRDLIGWDTPPPPTAHKWRPRPLNHDQWPPDYDAVYRWRAERLTALRADPVLLASARSYYADKPAEFIMDWMDTYDPRKTEGKWMPFVFFARQADVLEFLKECLRDGESGLVEKCRDAGLSWLAIAFSIHQWLFVADIAIGWGSRKQDLVDKIGSADSIFEKMRLVLRRLPNIWMPENFSWSRHSKQLLLLNPDNGAIIEGEAGDGIGRGGRKSAQPLDTLVLTPTGFKQMGELKVGDKVIGSDGQSTEILAVKDWGERQVFRVSFSDGTSTECDAEHLWTVRDKLSRKNIKRAKKIRGVEWKTLSTEEMIPNLMYLGREVNFEIPITMPIADFTSREPLLNPYIMGVLLGDGSIKYIKTNTPSFTSIDSEIVENVRERLPEGFELRTNGVTHSICYMGGCSGAGNVTAVKKALIDYGLDGKGSENKFIPDDYKFGSLKTRIEILQGLMDTDGWVNKRDNAGKVCIGLSSERMIDDIRFIVQSLGGTCRKTIKKTTHLNSYVLTINLPPYINPFLLKRKAERVGYRIKYNITRFIQSIEPVRITPVRCIQVSNDDGLYLVNDCIITHNCYFLDEAAHVERPEKIEAALGDNTNVRIDISSVNGLGNVFHRRRENGVVWERGKSLPRGFVRVFVMDWSHHPDKTQDWYDTRKARYEREGLAHVFAQEVDRNYSAAVSNVVIPYEWIEACVDAHVHIPYLAQSCTPERMARWVAGLDIADEGSDRNALALRQWVIIRSITEWGERDPGVSARKAIIACRPHSGFIECQYDSIGVGSGVKTEYNRLTDDDRVINRRDIPFVPWNAGSGTLRPTDRIVPDDDESMMNKDFFDNLKAQGWWALRTRCYKTFKARKDGAVYSPDELISLDSAMGSAILEQLKKEMGQPTFGHSTRLKMLIEKKPSGTKSPNLADAVMMCCFPLPSDQYEVQVGTYGS